MSHGDSCTNLSSRNCVVESTGSGGEMLITVTSSGATVPDEHGGGHCGLKARCGPGQIIGSDACVPTDRAPLAFPVEGVQGV